MTNRSSGFGFWRSDTDKMDIDSRFLEIPDPRDVEETVLFSVDFERELMRSRKAMAMRKRREAGERLCQAETASGAECCFPARKGERYCGAHQPIKVPRTKNVHVPWTPSFRRPGKQELRRLYPDSLVPRDDFIAAPPEGSLTGWRKFVDFEGNDSPALVDLGVGQPLFEIGSFRRFDIGVMVAEHIPSMFHLIASTGAGDLLIVRTVGMHSVSQDTTVWLEIDRDAILGACPAARFIAIRLVLERGQTCVVYFGAGDRAFVPLDG